MNQTIGAHSRPAFALIEAAVALAMAGILIAVLLIHAQGARRLARLGEDVTQLRGIGAATSAYGNDYGELFATFSWRAGLNQTPYTDLQYAGNDFSAALYQMVHIIRSRGGRGPSFFPSPFDAHVLVHPLYNHLVLAEYLDRPLPWLAPISAADAHRRKWATDYACFDAGCYLPLQPDPTAPYAQRWPYSSSFMPSVSFFDKSSVGNRVANGGTYNSYIGLNFSTFGGQLLSTVRYPSQKVMYHDEFARHFGPRQPYSTHPEARLPFLMAEGSVQVRSAADANPGWQPNQPAQPDPIQYVYSAATTPWLPPALSPTGSDIVAGRFRYTRGGVLGRDFGGPETQ